MRRSRSPRGIEPRKRTVGAREMREQLRAVLLPAVSDRPMRWDEDCAGGPRPCPLVGCSNNLYLDVTEAGSITFNFPNREPWEMPADRSCVGDLVHAARMDGGTMTLEATGFAMNVTRERVRQIEVRALIKLKRKPGLAELVEVRAPRVSFSGAKVYQPKPRAPCSRCGRVVVGKQAHRCIGCEPPAAATPAEVAPSDPAGAPSSG